MNPKKEFDDAGVTPDNPFDYHTSTPGELQLVTVLKILVASGKVDKEDIKSAWRLVQL